MSARNDCNCLTAILRSFSDRPLRLMGPSVPFRMLLVSLPSPDIAFFTAAVGRFSGFKLAVAAESVFLCLFVDVGLVGLLGASSTLPARWSESLGIFEVTDPTRPAVVDSTSAPWLRALS